MRERNPDWSNTLLNIHDVDGAYTVLQSDSGKVFMLSSTGGACEITLPVAANLREGWNCKFVVKEDTPTGVITIAAGSAISIYMETIVGNIYIKLGATFGDPVATDSHIYLLAGEHCVVPLNPNATAMAGIRYITDSASGRLLYLVTGK